MVRFRPRLADVALALAGVALVVSTFLPWTGAFDGTLTGWELTSHFGVVWDLADEGSSDTVWIDSGLFLTTGAVAFVIGAAVTAIAAMHLRPRTPPASSTVSMWFAGLAALVVGLSPWFALATPPPDDARIGVLVGMAGGMAIPAVLIVDVVARALRFRRQPRVHSLARWWTGIGLLLASAFALLPSLDALAEDRPFEYRLEEAIAWVTIALVVGGIGGVLVARNRHAA